MFHFDSKKSAWMSALLIGAAGTIGCSNSGGAAPPKPDTGAPVAFEVSSVKKDALDVRAYNFSDKDLAAFQLVLRYRDASGNVLKVKPGTPFESDFDHWSVSGLSFKTKPNAWTKMTFDHLQIPPGAAKAEVLATEAKALASDGLTFEKEPLWKMGYVAKWPGK